MRRLFIQRTLFCNTLWNNAGIKEIRCGDIRSRSFQEREDLRTVSVYGVRFQSSQKKQNGTNIRLERRITFPSKIAFPPFILCPDSRQKDSAQGSPYLEMLEKGSWVLEDDLKYAGEVVCLGVLYRIKLKGVFHRKHLSDLSDH